ncbi:hypothetical protein GF420_10805 [candidate division GN15 bacterium]|nr:hypothetical protein [candidate division GN15 bacterium]
MATMLLALVLLSMRAEAVVRVSEVMSNEPGGQTAAEWFELYNDSPTTDVSLALYTIVADGSIISFAAPQTIPADGYLVVCRDFFDYEQVYGDASGIWGDTDKEQYNIVQPSSSFSLSNDSGTISAVRPNGSRDDLTWTAAGLDGVSWERFAYDTSGVRQSRDPDGATPGRVNSQIPVGRDLSVDTLLIVPTETGARALIIVTNRGVELIEEDTLRLFQVDQADTANTSALLESFAITQLDTGFSLPIVYDLDLPGIYDTIGAVLPDDDRVRNNRRDAVAVGVDFPPIRLSEFLANPQGTASAEWVELFVRSDLPHDLAGWQLGDALGLETITETSQLVMPGAYPILTDNEAAFAQDYPSFSETIMSIPGWQTLNNGSDIVRLVDPFGFVADSFAYNETYDDNHTWAYGIDQNEIERWGRSSDGGGTPGDSNDIRFAPISSGLSVTVEPQVVSPDGDGIEDELSIRVSGPANTAYTIRIYDQRGREVRSFEDGAADLRPEYLWDGRTDTGARLPIGMYILYVEAEGVESVKKTVVVAR